MMKRMFVFITAAADNDKAAIYVTAVQHLEKVRVKNERYLFIPIGSEATKVKQEERTVASVDVDVVVKDAKGKVISRFTVTGKSSGGTIFAGTTDQALEKAAAQIAAFMDAGKQ